MQAADAAAARPDPLPRTRQSSSPTRTSPTGTPQPERPTSASTTRSRRPSARRSARPTAEDRLLYGFVNHDVATTYLGSSPRPPPAARAADRALRLHRQGHLSSPAAPGPGARPATSATSTPRRWPRRSPSASPGPQRRIDLPAGRYDTILPPSSVADLMIDAYWGAGARVAHEGESVYSRAAAAPGSATRSPPRASASSPTRPTRARVRPVRHRRRVRQHRLGLRQRPGRSSAPTGSATAC